MVEAITFKTKGNAKDLYREQYTSIGLYARCIGKYQTPYLSTFFILPPRFNLIKLWGISSLGSRPWYTNWRVLGFQLICQANLKQIDQKEDCDKYLDHIREI